MITYELTNNQRRYFGLSFVTEDLDREQLNNSTIVYFSGDKIVKVLDYRYGYWEYDVEIDTRQRKILLPKTARGKEQNLTVPKILKIKGSGVQFSGSFLGGGIHVYDNKRNLFFIKSYPDEGEIKSFADIDNWLNNYISKASPDYFDWLSGELSQKRQRINAREGDVIAFKIGQSEYGFARIIVDVFLRRQLGETAIPNLQWFHPRSLIVAPYAHYANDLKVDLNELACKKTLPTVCIFDLDVHRGEMPIVGYIPLSPEDRKIPLPGSPATGVTIRYTKKDIETFITQQVSL